MDADQHGWDTDRYVLRTHFTQLFEKKGCPRNIISFDKEKFVNQISDELYTSLNKSMIDYFNEKN